MRERNRHNMPDGFEAPVPAWAAVWPDDVDRLTTACFAVQGGDTQALSAWAGQALAGADAPELREWAGFVDAAGVHNTVIIAYWRNDGFARWAVRPDTLAWWARPERLAGPVGYWREVFHVPAERLETLHSTEDRHGVATLVDTLDGPVDEHAYPGAARDRIPVSGSEDLRGPPAPGPMLPAERSDDGRRTVVRPHRNMCVIRSGQDWSHCGNEERDFYLGQVQPSLLTGMDFLRDNPAETRCLSMRLMRTIGPRGEPMEQTFGLGYALDVFAFEEWARSHPTHVRIFEQFMAHAGRFGEDMQLRLWHEVSVMTGHDAEFEYLNCHDKTGLLPYAAA
ncbi:MAG: phenylacetaldoxime dehydratase family protein [Pseudomonadota bacterium]